MIKYCKIYIISHYLQHTKSIMEDRNKQVVAKIKEIRTSKNVPQQILADVLNITVTAYSRIENNKTQLTINNLFAIAEALEVSVAELLRLQYSKNVNNHNSLVIANFNDGTLHFSLDKAALEKWMSDKKK
ncbi:MAG: helix-turn-helix transcriptional regulator [Niabella sp.]